MTLLEVRSYDEIRIEDICHQADLGRATFYLHFTTKNELLLATLKRLVDDYLSQPLVVDPAVPTYLALARSLIDFMSQQRLIFQRMLESTDAGAIDQLVCRHMSKALSASMAQYFNLDGLSHSPWLDYLANQVATSLYEAGMWWIRTTPSVPLNELQDRFVVTTDAGVRSFLAMMGVTTPKANE